MGEEPRWHSQSERFPGRESAWRLGPRAWIGGGGREGAGESLREELRAVPGSGSICSPLSIRVGHQPRLDSVDSISVI